MCLMVVSSSYGPYFWILSGNLPGVVTPVLLKHLCSHRVSRTSETHPRLFQSLQTILETVHGTRIHCVKIWWDVFLERGV